MTAARPLDLLSMTRPTGAPAAAPRPPERPSERLRPPDAPRGSLTPDRGIQNTRPILAPPGRGNAVDRLRGALRLGEHELSTEQGEALDRLRAPRDLQTARRDVLTIVRALAPAAREDAALAGALALLRDQAITALARHHRTPVVLERGMNTVLGITTTTPEPRLDAQRRQAVAGLRLLARETNDLMRAARALPTDYRPSRDDENEDREPAPFEPPDIGSGNVPTDTAEPTRGRSTESPEPARIITHARRVNSPGNTDHVVASLGNANLGISVSAAGGEAPITGGSASDDGAPAVTVRVGNLVAGVMPGEYVTHPAVRGRPELGVPTTVTGGLTDQLRLPDGATLRFYGGAHVHTVGRYGGAHFSIVRDDGRRTFEFNGSVDRAIGVELRLRGRF